ncbi:MAG: anti-sigma factor [Cellulomonas sp.]
MQHPEPEELALAALGEPLDGATRDHLISCEECREEVASYTATVSVGRAVAADGSDTLIAPPPQVWRQIVVELGLSTEIEPGEIRLASPADTLGTGGTEPEHAPAVTEVTTLRSRSDRFASGSKLRPTIRWIVAAAAAGVIVGGGGATWWADRSTPAPAVMEAAALEALPGWTGATGAAKVEVAADGTRSLVVTLGGAKSEAGYHAVWLIDKGVTKLVSVGVLDGSTGTFALPPGLDLGEYPVVDISQQHFNGNPAHSGDSIVRGILAT